jgi:2-hydroxymethylglutarate dehydrogenase
MEVGFIGIGQMGKHMARRIFEAGYNLTIHDISKEAAMPLVEKGARWADSPMAVAAACDVVITSLPTPPIVEQVIYGTNGLKSAWKKGDVYIDMSTNSPALIQKIAKDAADLGVAVLDAPVSGASKGAEMGTLTIMIGGDPAVLEKVRKLLETMGKRIFRVGDVGSGNAAKLVNNLIAIGCSSISAEGMVLGVKAGLDPQVLWDIITTSTGNNWALQQYPNSIFQGNFAPMYSLNLAHKDIGLAVDMGKEYGVPLQSGAVVEQKLIEAKAAGLGEKSVDSFITRLEQVSGVQVRKAQPPK